MQIRQMTSSSNFQRPLVQPITTFLTEEVAKLLTIRHVSVVMLITYKEYLPVQLFRLSAVTIQYKLIKLRTDTVWGHNTTLFSLSFFTSKLPPSSNQLKLFKNHLSSDFLPVWPPSPYLIIQQHCDSHQSPLANVLKINQINQYCEQKSCLEALGKSFLFPYYFRKSAVFKIQKIAVLKADLALPLGCEQNKKSENLCFRTGAMCVELAISAKQRLT